MGFFRESFEYFNYDLLSNRTRRYPENFDCTIKPRSEEAEMLTRRYAMADDTDI